MEKNGIDNPKILIIAGSAGSFSALMLLVETFTSAKVIYVLVQHRKTNADPILTDLIKGKTNLPVHEVEDKDAILPGHIYIAPANYHLLFESKKTFSLDNSEKINFSRPSFDVTFESAADIFSIDATGILLSGANEDGAIGILKIKKAGGVTLVQDPTEAQVDCMPKKAIDMHAHTHIMQTQEMISYIKKNFD